MPANINQLLEKNRTILEQIGNLSPFRPGSLVENYRKCGKPTCHCAKEGALGHGPHWLLTRSVGGKTVSKIIKTSQLESTQEQISRFRRFQELTHEYVETNVLICDGLLDASGDAGLDEAEKGGSKRP